MHNIPLALIMVLAMTASGGPRGDDGSKEEKALFITEIAVDFAGNIVPPGHFVVSLNEGELVFSYESNMVAAQKVPAKVEASKEYNYLPKLEVIKKSPKIIINYLSQDKRYSIRGVEKADYKAPEKRQVEQVKKQDEKVAAPKAQDDYYTNLKEVLKKLESQVAHCEDVAIRRNAGPHDEKLTLCVCPIAQKWKLPPAKTLFRKDRRFKKKTHGYSLLIDDKGKVVDCAVWDKKPQNPFTREYVYEGDGVNKPAAPTNQ